MRWSNGQNNWAVRTLRIFYARGVVPRTALVVRKLFSELFGWLTFSQRLHKSLTYLCNIIEKEIMFVLGRESVYVRGREKERESESVRERDREREDRESVYVCVCLSERDRERKREMRERKNSREHIKEK